MTIHDDCPDCDGTGKQPPWNAPEGMKDCPACDGTGVIEIEEEGDDDRLP
jgi:DnaJ-class molecular chaperone